MANVKSTKVTVGSTAVELAVAGDSNSVSVLSMPGNAGNSY